MSQTRIELSLLEGMHLQAVSPDGNVLDIDKDGKGFRPMQMLLAAVGGCSAFDVIGILEKQRQPLEDLKISVSGEREEGKEANLWRKVHVTFRLWGELDEAKVARAVQLSMEKYCSVSKTLEPTAEITYSHEVVAKTEA